MMMFSRKNASSSSSIIGGGARMMAAIIVLLDLSSSLYTCDAAFFVIQGSSSRRHSGNGGVIITANNHGRMFTKTTDKTGGWGSSWQSQWQWQQQLNLGPAEAWSAYNDALEASPLLVKSVTASVILGAADLTGQSLEKIRKQQQAAEPGAAAAGAVVVEENLEEDQVVGNSIDWPRAIRFAIFGLVLQAPWNHFYYMALDGQIPPTTEPFTLTNGIKVLIDQFIQAPIFTVLIFVFLGILEGKSTQAIENQLKNDYKETILANWKLWVPATVINIGFVPPLFRVLYLNCVFFFWSIYLSLVLNKNEPEA